MNKHINKKKDTQKLTPVIEIFSLPNNQVTAKSKLSQAQTAKILIDLGLVFTRLDEKTKTLSNAKIINPNNGQLITLGNLN